jgi:hypothetical protein
MVSATVLAADGERAGIFVLAGFLGSFGFIRTSARLMRSPRVPWWPGSVKVAGGLHIHTSSGGLSSCFWSARADGDATTTTTTTGPVAGPRRFDRCGIVERRRDGAAYPRRQSPRDAAFVDATERRPDGRWALEHPDCGYRMSGAPAHRPPRATNAIPRRPVFAGDNARTLGPLVELPAAGVPPASFGIRIHAAA